MRTFLLLVALAAAGLAAVFVLQRRVPGPVHRAARRRGTARRPIEK